IITRGPMYSPVPPPPPTPPAPGPGGGRGHWKAKTRPRVVTIMIVFGPNSSAGRVMFAPGLGLPGNHRLMLFDSLGLIYLSAARKLEGEALVEGSSTQMLVHPGDLEELM